MFGRKQKKAQLFSDGRKGKKQSSVALGEKRRGATQPNGFCLGRVAAVVGETVRGSNGVLPTDLIER